MKKGSITYEMVPVKELKLDTKNPRIAQWVEMYGDKISDEAMKLALQRGGSDDKVAGPSYRGLQESIRTNRGVIYPIIVNRDKKGNLIVIEGNTRALIYREFLDTGIEGNWKLIPAIVYENMGEGQIDAIRLQAHLVGARDWDPYSKAKYLNMLRNELHLPWAQVVDYGGGNQRELERLVLAYNDMEKYYRPISDQDFDPTRFSGFVELQNPRVTQALVTSGYTKSDFAKWIDDKILHPLEMVRQLPRILQHEKSKEVFFADGAREALKVLDALEKPEEVSLESASLEALSREIYTRINEIPFSEIMRLRSETDAEEKDLIRNALDALTNLWKDITAEGD
jgi:hypothetical protein